jgi:hypothetical protein
MNTFTVGKFSWHRLGLFVKSDLVINSSRIFTFSATIFVVLFLYSLISAKFIVDNFHPVLFLFVLFVGGLWLTSRSFVDLHDQERSSHFLLLPATNLEKFLGRLLLTTIGYMVGTVLIFYVVSLLVAGFTWLVFGKISVIFQPMHKDMVHFLAIYMVYHSIFFLGAVYFKTNNFSKTNLCLCGLGLVFFLLAVIIFWIFLGVNIFDGWRVLNDITLGLIFAIILLPGIWLAAYLRLCESET